MCTSEIPTALQHLEPNMFFEEDEHFEDAMSEDQDINESPGDERGKSNVEVSPLSELKDS